MDEILKAIHANLAEINVKGQDVLRLANVILMLEQAIAMSEMTEPQEES